MTLRVWAKGRSPPTTIGNHHDGLISGMLLKIEGEEIK
jgi:hypothetical protein